MAKQHELTIVTIFQIQQAQRFKKEISLFLYMRVPSLGESSYFQIPPHVSLSELEARLNEAYLHPEAIVQLSINQARLSHRGKYRSSGESVLEQHIYPVALSVIEHEKYHNQPVAPRIVALALLHDVLDDDPRMDKNKFEKQFGAEMLELILPLSDIPYGSLEYGQKTKQRFDKLKKSPKELSIIALADRLNNLLCMYTEPFIHSDGRAKPLLISRVLIAEDIVKPYAELVSPHFFGVLLTEAIEYYKSRYPLLSQKY